MFCNDCCYLTLSENEQNRLKLKGMLRYHWCAKYNKQVFHHTQARDHDETIYPCDECEYTDLDKLTLEEAIQKDLEETRLEHFWNTLKNDIGKL